MASDKYDNGMHSIYTLSYHLIIVTKYRARILDDEKLALVRETFERIAPHHGIVLEEINHDLDHVHFLFRATPKTELSKFIGTFKSAASRHLRKRFPEIKEKLWGGAVWSTSYFLATTGGASLDVVRAYIESQGKGQYSLKTKKGKEKLRERKSTQGHEL